MVQVDLRSFKSDIDFCHRLQAKKGKGEAKPTIIIRFKTMNSRMAFYSQRQKLKGITAEHLKLKEPVFPEDTVEREVFVNGEKERKNYIYILESLTQTNGELLKDAKQIAKALNYQFFGYTVRGEVRVRKAEGIDHIAIRCRDDLKKII